MYTKTNKEDSYGISKENTNRANTPINTYYEVLVEQIPENSKIILSCSYTCRTSDGFSSYIENLREKLSKIGSIVQIKKI